MAPAIGLLVIHNGPFDRRLHCNEAGEVHGGAGGPPPDRHVQRETNSSPRGASPGGIDFDLIYRKIKNQYQKQKRADGY